MNKATRVKLMSELGKVGGKARAKKLSKARRAEIARAGGRASAAVRWGKKAKKAETE